MRQFRSVNPWSNVVKHCAEQLSKVFSELHNRAITEHIPSKWKDACITIPVPKTSATASEMNDFRPMTSVIMKCLERLILRY